jgi:hypothetical protein
MKVFVNGTPFDPAAATGTMGELFDQIRADATWMQGIICQMAIDGEAVTLPQPDDPFPPTGTGQRLEIGVERPEVILQRGLADADELVDVMVKMCRAGAAAFRAGNRRDGHEALAMLTDKVSLFVEFVVEVVRFVELSFEGFSGAATAQGLLAELVEIMKKIMSGQQTADEVLLADCLEYELPATFDRWRAFLAGSDFVMEK